MINDTIAAIATAPGQGGVAIVRLSGPEAEAILLRVFRPAGKQALPLTSHHDLIYRSAHNLAATTIMREMTGSGLLQWSMQTWSGK